MQEKVKILNSKGQNIAAVIHKPEQDGGKLAILCPGFCDSKDYTHLVELADELSKEGFTAIRFDPTGTWESEGSMDDYTNTQYLNDVKSVLEFMERDRSYSYILLGGHSRGGQVSILYAAREPRISLVLGIMPSASLNYKNLDKWREQGFRVTSRDIPVKEEKIDIRIPFSHVLDQEKYNALEDIKKIKVPVVLINGEEDTSLIPGVVKKLYDCANEPKKFINIPKVGHDYRHNLEEVKIVNKVILENI